MSKKNPKTKRKENQRNRRTDKLNMTDIKNNINSKTINLEDLEFNEENI